MNSGSGPEKSANSPASTAASASTASTAPAPKPRSCVVCRSRKVRCDKQSPCSNCRRAGIACVLPPNDRPPRWARRLELITSNAASQPTSEVDPKVGQVMDRLRYLETLVKDLSGQLDRANASASSKNTSPASSANDRFSDQSENHHSAALASEIHKGVGKLVLQDANKSRYISSGFWSTVSDELHELEMDTRAIEADTDSSDDEYARTGNTQTTAELERTPAERHGFLFQHNLMFKAPNLRELHPLPSQIPFYIDTYAENVNLVIQIVHIPTVTQMIRNLPGKDLGKLTPVQESLMFAIYYAVVASMEEKDINTNFGTAQGELILKYRAGLEQALARADFLNVPDIMLVQAFAIFLFLARRYDSPRYVWMMTGLAIRMAQALGLHRDGAHFDQLSPFEVEMRRRVWWALCLLDMRSSEDQGTELTIASGSFDTKLPSNINDSDFGPKTQETPEEREIMTDMTPALSSAHLLEVMREMVTFVPKNVDSRFEEQGRLLEDIKERFVQSYLKYAPDTTHILYWVITTISRLVIAKMSIIVYTPIVFTASNSKLSEDLRSKLLVAALEVAESNHALNSDERCRQWRWIYQTYTHWHAILFILLEISRRPWSATVERAWVALHSNWLIPTQSKQEVEKNLRIWVPLKKLMIEAQRHRSKEISRLRRDPQAARELEKEDRSIYIPPIFGPFTTDNQRQLHLERWRQLLQDTHGFPSSSGESCDGNAATSRSNSLFPARSVGEQAWDSHFDMIQQPLVSSPPPSYMSGSAEHEQYANHGDQFSMGSYVPATSGSYIGIQSAMYQNASPEAALAIPSEWSAENYTAPMEMPWLWTNNDAVMEEFGDIDMNLDPEMDFNWHEWVESAKGIQPS